MAAAAKTVGAQVRGRCEPHPQVLASIKSVPNERVVAALDDLDVIGLSTADLKALYMQALAGLVEALEDDDAVLANTYAEALAEYAASRPMKPIDRRVCASIARRVISQQTP